MIILGVDPGLAAHRLRRHRDRRPPPPPPREGRARAPSRASPCPSACTSSTRAWRALIARLRPDVLAVEDVFHAVEHPHRARARPRARRGPAGGRRGGPARPRLPARHGEGRRSRASAARRRRRWRSWWRGSSSLPGDGEAGRRRRRPGGRALPRAPARRRRPARRARRAA